MLKVKTCSGCHSELLEEYFSRNRKGEFNKCCNNCLNRFKCPTCDKRFKTKPHLKRHIDSIHLKLKPHKCDLCNESFSEKENLQRHADGVHLKLKPHKCPECEQSFSLKRTLQRHINATHLKLKPYKCPECEQSFSQKENLQIHINSIHLKLKPYKCPECPYRCSQKGSLKKHIKVCTGEINCSADELRIMKLLDRLDISYVFDETHGNVRDKGLLKFDFRIDTDGDPVFIEFDGEYHLNAIKRSRTMTQSQAEDNLRTTQKRDRIKDKYCYDNGYLMLRVSYLDRDTMEDIITEFLNENLAY